jgi:hypothetical protein
MRTVAILGVGMLLALCVARHDELLTAVATVPPATLIGLAALHLLGLAARSEAWRLSLGAIGGAAPPRRVVHTANAGAFVVGALVVARLAAGRRATRGLAVLADVRRRAALTGLVAFIVCCGLARILLALSVVHLNASPSEVAVAFASSARSGCSRSGRRPRPVRCWCSPAAPGRWPPGSC